VAAARSGDIYVSDTSNHTIRRIAPDGTVSTVAGLPGVPGYADGLGANARLDGPQKIALDGDGNILVADYNNCVIRKVSPDGQVTTVAGTAGVHGGMDGPFGKALLAHPLGMSADASGNLYLTDGYVVRRVTKDGSLHTLAGSPKVNTTPNTSLAGSDDGTGSKAGFASPSGLAVHTSGDLFIADRNNHTIRRLKLVTQTETSYFSHFADGDGLASTLVLMNPSLSSPCTATIRFRNSNGQPFGVDLNGVRVGGEHAVSLAPGGSAWLRTDGAGPLTTGWVEIASEFPIAGTLLFSGSLGLGAVSSSAAATRLRIPVEIDNARGVDSGVAFSNPSAHPVTLSLGLRDNDGNPVQGAASELVLPAGAQIARFPGELFPGTANSLGSFRGTLDACSTAPICAMALRLARGSMTALPVIR
jgi:hypothetical protein